MKRKRKKPITQFSGEDWGVEPSMSREDVCTPAWVTHRDQEDVCTPAGVTHRDQEWYDAEIA